MFGRRFVRLEATRYSDMGVYSVPNGFAVVTRLEAVDEAGAPLSLQQRFRPPWSDLEFSFIDYIRQLFFAPEGYYRFICFFVTDQQFTPSNSVLTDREAAARLEAGAIGLPREPYSRMPFSEAHEVHVFVYEFRKHGDEVETLRPGRLLVEDHLRHSGLLAALTNGP